MTEFTITAEDKKALLKIARETIQTFARTGRKPPLPSSLSPALESQAGAFVTLHKRGQLRGCIGTFFGEEKLAITVQKMAMAAGWEDPRFSELMDFEVQEVDLEISVLSPLREIENVSEIQVGRHGIYITKGYNRGVLLPQVATEQKWDRDTFLSHTCVKAGLPPDAWRKGGLKIEVFTAEVFGEKEFK